MAQRHEFEKLHSEQWGRQRGGRPSDAASYWHCKRCGVRFTHRYNVQLDIYEAIKDAGIDVDNCPHNDNDNDNDITQTGEHDENESK